MNIPLFEEFEQTFEIRLKERWAGYQTIKARVPAKFYHGTPDKRHINGKLGIHIGSKLAATQALQARIGVPSQGEWDGTRSYGETLLAGRKRLKQLGPFLETGFNCRAPEEDYYPTDRADRADYSDGTLIPFDAIPDIFVVHVVGRMSNGIFTPHSDAVANGMIKRTLGSGHAKSGFYYVNMGEDSGSVSAVVPDWSFLRMG